MTVKDTLRSQESDQPPAYDVSVEPYTDASKDPKVVPANANINALQAPSMTAGLSYTPAPLGGQAPTVYNYVNPSTGEQVVSLLPPDHPEMICLQAGEHITRTDYGLLGILAAIFWFPLGVGLCLLDKRVKCQRCGLVIEDGLCR